MRSRPGRRVTSTSRLGRRDAALHQVEQVGAGRQIGGARHGGGRDGFADRRRPHIIEGLHATFLRLAASSALLRVQHRLGDSRIGAAAAEIAAHAFAHALRIVAGLASSIRPIALMIWPGVQKPHWKPSWAMKAGLHRMQVDRPAPRPRW